MPSEKNSSKRRVSEIKEEYFEIKKSRTSRRSRASSLTPIPARADTPTRRRRAEEEHLLKPKLVQIPQNYNGLDWFQCQSTIIRTKVVATGQPHSNIVEFFQVFAFVLLKIRDRGNLVPGDVFSLGTGDVGQLGLGPDVIEKGRPAIIQSLSTVVEVCAGGMHTVCLTKDGKVITFGCNDEGALGRDTSKEGSEWSPGDVAIDGKVAQVTAGDSHSAALLEDGRVFAWGTFRDSHGTMGLMEEDQVQRLPVEILKNHPSGGAVRLASGSDHLVILTRDGQVLTCGCGEQGQLGRVSERSAGRGSRQGMAPLLMPMPIHLKRSLKVFFDEIWTGAYCTFARDKSKGDIYVCGLNNYNQLGHPETSPIFHPVPAPTFTGKHWIQISGGQHHTLALDETGIAHSLGRKEYGRLGLGPDCEDAVKPTSIPSLLSKKTIWVACGSSVSYAVTEDGLAFSWGMGTNYQLGFGDDDSDVQEPKMIKSKQLEGRKTICVSGGGQHAVILAAKVEDAPNAEAKEAEKNSKE